MNRANDTWRQDQYRRWLRTRTRMWGAPPHHLAEPARARKLGFRILAAIKGGEPIDPDTARDIQEQLGALAAEVERLRGQRDVLRRRLAREYAHRRGEEPEGPTMPVDPPWPADLAWSVTGTLGAAIHTPPRVSRDATLSVPLDHPHASDLLAAVLGECDEHGRPVVHATCGVDGESWPATLVERWVAGDAVMCRFREVPAADEDGTP